jgi:predicted TIM-barrel fold metal-dependent hydrolase
MPAPTVDIHHHILPPSYTTALGERIGHQGLFGSPPAWTPQISVEAMDRNGIDLAIVSISAPGVWFGDPQESERLARDCNDYAARLKADFPDRFGFFATLPLPDTDATLREIERALDILGADGVVLMSNYGGTYPGDGAFRPVLEELDRRGAIVFLHPTAAAYANPLPHIPPPSLEFTFETTRAITSLLYGGTLARCRNARFIFAHAGGTVPFLAMRIARLTARPEFASAASEGVLPELRRLYFDTALSANSFALDPLLRLTSASNVLFGSDFPHAGEQTLAATLRGLENVGLADIDLAGIKGCNAHRLLQVFRSPNRA